MATATETELEPGEKPPEAPPPTVAETPKPLPDPLTGVVQARLESGRRERDLYLEREAATAPARAAVLEETQRPRPAIPEAPTLPAVPAQQRRPFLEGPGNETPAQSLQRFVAGLTTFASVVGGLVAGDAKFALSGLTGAIHGWQAGDQKRLDDEWKQWDAATTRMLRQYEMQRKQYDDVLKDMTLGMDQKARALQVISLTNGDALMAEKATQGNLDVVIKHMEVQAKQAMEMARHQADLNMRAFLAQQNAEMRSMQLEETTRAHRESERLRQEEIDRRREAERVKVGEKPVYAPAGGAWYDRTAKEYQTMVESGAIQKEPSRYIRLSGQEKQLLDFLETTPPMLRRMREIIPTLLAKYPGQNLSRTIELVGAGKLAASDDLREYLSLRRQLTVEATRILGGGGQLRVTLMKALEDEASPRIQDTISTADRSIQTLAIDFENRRRGMLQQKPLEYTSAIGPGMWRVKNKQTGEEKGVKLDEGEVLPVEWTRIAPIFPGVK